MVARRQLEVHLTHGSPLTLDRKAQRLNHVRSEPAEEPPRDKYRTDREELSPETRGDD